MIESLRPRGFQIYSARPPTKLSFVSAITPHQAPESTSILAMRLLATNILDFKEFA